MISTLRFNKFQQIEPFLITKKDNVKKHWHTIGIGVKPCPDIIPLLVGDFAYCCDHTPDKLV